MAELTDEEIRRALGDAPQLSFARKRPGHVLVDRERLLDGIEESGHDREEECLGRHAARPPSSPPRSPRTLKVSACPFARARSPRRPTWLAELTHG